VGALSLLTQVVAFADGSVDADVYAAVDSYMLREPLDTGPRPQGGFFKPNGLVRLAIRAARSVGEEPHFYVKRSQAAYIIKEVHLSMRAPPPLPDPRPLVPTAAVAGAVAAQPPAPLPPYEAAVTAAEGWVWHAAPRGGAATSSRARKWMRLRQRKPTAPGAEPEVSLTLHSSREASDSAALAESAGGEAAAAELSSGGFVWLPVSQLRTILSLWSLVAGCLQEDGEALDRAVSVGTRNPPKGFQILSICKVVRRAGTEGEADAAGRAVPLVQLCATPKECVWLNVQLVALGVPLGGLPPADAVAADDSSVPLDQLVDRAADVTARSASYASEVLAMLPNLRSMTEYASATSAVATVMVNIGGAIQNVQYIGPIVSVLLLVRDAVSAVKEYGLVVEQVRRLSRTVWARRRAGEAP
jgi:hypothetical protein